MYVSNRYYAIKTYLVYLVAHPSHRGCMSVLFPYLFLAGGHSREATPDPLPNSAVKISSADGTAVKTVGEQVAAGLFIFARWATTSLVSLLATFLSVYLLDIRFFCTRRRGNYYCRRGNYFV